MTLSPNIETERNMEDKLTSILENYFKEKDLGEKGGLFSDFYRAKIGNYSILLPNTNGRKKALIKHDIHHLLTDYNVDFKGELEIGGWEVASGCSNYYGIWMLNLIGMATGLFLIPKRTYNAFIKGIGAMNLYQLELEDADYRNRSLEDIQKTLKYDPANKGEKNWKNNVKFICWSIIAIIATLISPPYYILSMIALLIKNGEKVKLIEKLS